MRNNPKMRVTWKISLRNQNYELKGLVLCLKLGLQLVALSGKDGESSGDGDLLEEVNHLGVDLEILQPGHTSCSFSSS